MSLNTNLTSQLEALDLSRPTSSQRSFSNGSAHLTDAHQPAFTRNPVSATSPPLFAGGPGSSTTAPLGESSGALDPPSNSFSFTTDFDAESFFRSLHKMDFSRSVGMLTNSCYKPDWFEQFEETLFVSGLEPFLMNQATLEMERAVKFILRTTVQESIRSSYFDPSASIFENYQMLKHTLLKPRDPRLLLKEMSELSFDGKVSVESYFSKFNKLKHELTRAQGNPPPTYLINNILLDNLQGEYKGLVLTFHGEEQLTPTIIRHRMESRYQFLQGSRKYGNTSTKPSTSTSNKSQSTDTKKEDKRSRNTIFCNYCKKPGHVIANCPVRPPKADKNASTVANVTVDPAIYLGNVCVPSTPAQLNLVPSHPATKAHIVLDSGAEVSITANQDMVHDFQPSKPEDQPHICGPDGKRIHVTGNGNMVLSLGNSTNTAGAPSYTTPVYVCPGTTHTLLSTKQLKAAGLLFQERPSGTYLVADDDSEIELHPIGNLSTLPDGALVSPPARVQAISVHERLGHVNRETVKLSIKHGCIAAPPGAAAELDRHALCDPCLTGKAKRAPAIRGSRDQYRAKEAFHTIHSDIMGPFLISGQKCYFVSFIDDYTHFSILRIVPDLTSIADLIPELVKYVEKQFDASVKTFFSDQGTEYTQAPLTKWFSSQGIGQRFSTTYSPRSNGFAERFNYTVMQDSRTLLAASGVPSGFIREAALYSVYIRNRMYRADLGDSPFRHLTKRSLHLEDFHTFGEKVIATILPYKDKKMPRGEEGFYLMPSEVIHGHVIYVPALRKNLHTRHVAFTGTYFFSQTTADKNGDHELFERLLAEYAPQEESLLEAEVPQRDDVKPNPPPTICEHPVESEDDILMDDLPTQSETPSETHSVDPHLTSVPSTSDHDDTSPAYSEPHLLDPLMSTGDNETSINSDLTTFDHPVHSDDLPAQTSDGPASTHAIPSYLRSDLIGAPDQIQLPTSSIAERTRKRQHRHDHDTATKYFRVQFVSQSVHAVLNNNISPQEKTDAREVELNSHSRLETWDTTPVDPTADIVKRCVPTQWIYTRKASGLVKARLVARGDRQADTTYDSTYSPTLSQEGLHCVLAYASTQGWQLHQLDINAAYLNAEVTEELYLYLPTAAAKYSANTGKSHRPIHRLRKAIYGLKQSGREWFNHIKTHLVNIGYETSPSTPSVYRRTSGNRVTGLLAIFVDDILVLGDDPMSMAKDITDHYDTKTLPPVQDGPALRYNLLGYHIWWEHGKISLNKSEYIRQMVSRFCDELVPRKTPLPTNFQQFNPEQDPLELDQIELDRKTHRLRQMIGALVYVSSHARPDVTFAVQFLAKFTTYPHGKVLKAVNHLMQYLNSTADHRITYTNSEMSTTNNLVCFSDASLGDGPNSKSYLGAVVYLAGGPVSWNSMLSATVCLSSTESEVHALIEASRCAQHTSKIVSFISGRPLPCILATDNQSAITMLTSERYTARNKYYTMRFDKLKQDCIDGNFRLLYVPTEDQVADILTKGTTSNVVERLSALLYGLRSVDDILPHH